MTYREWVEKYAPAKLDSRLLGGVRGCPMGSMPCGDVGDSTCSACWDREMPGTIRTKKAKAVRKEPYNEEQIIEGCTVVIWRNSKTGDVSWGWMKAAPKEGGGHD